MMTGPSVGPGMLLTVLMRWPALIAVLAIGGSAYYAHEEYGLPESVEIALNRMQGLPTVKSDSSISDSNKARGVDHLAEATKVVEPASAPAPASAPEPVVMSFAPPVETKPEASIVEKYVVIEGDSLSKIAASRSSDAVIQRALIARMFNDNPHAFKDANPNQLHAGIEIVIPAK